MKLDFGLDGRFSANDHVSPSLELVPLFTANMGKVCFCKDFTLRGLEALWPHRVLITTLSSFKIKWLRTKAKFWVTVTPGFLQNASGDLRHLTSYPPIDLQLCL